MLISISSQNIHCSALAAVFPSFPGLSHLRKVHVHASRCSGQSHGVLLDASFSPSSYVQPTLNPVGSVLKRWPQGLWVFVFVFGHNVKLAGSQLSDQGLNLGSESPES